MAALIKKHPLLAYYLLTFALSWIGFVLVVGPGSLANTNWQAEGAFLSAVLVMLAGPSIAGLLLIGLVDGRAGYRDLVSRLCKWRVGLRWYAIAILPAPIVGAGVLFALSLTSPLLAADNRLAVLLGGLGAGVTTILEEIGWTGFAVPRLRRRHSVPMTGLIVGTLWGLWHFLQQVFVSGTYAGGIPLPAFLMLSVFAAVANLTAYRVLMVWVYDRTGSLLVTTLMHGMLTASSIFWFTPIATGALFLANVWLSAFLMWLVVGVVAVAEGWLHLGHTKPFRMPDGSVVPNSIAETTYVRLGGIDQWVMMRGENVANPPLIVLHGGPGMSEMGFFRHSNGPLERHFTVVHWDQRGTGKSFDRDVPRSSMTLDQFVADLDELVDIVRRRLGKTQVAILGHSWGSALGAIYAARFPEKVSIYIGAAQIGDWSAAESMSYASGLAEAERRHDEKALTKLRAIGPPPHPARSVFVERTVVTRMDGQMRLSILWKAGRALFGGPESSILDLPSLVRGFGFSMDAMWAEVSRLNLLKLVPELKMPVVIFVGRRDHWVPPETSVAFFDALTAPSKTLVWFDRSGHEAFVDEPEKFNATMVELVRPLIREPLAEAPAAASIGHSAFKTPKGETAFLATYDAAMKRWPVPYEEINLSTRFGMTHVVVCGPKGAPPLVLLHGYMATSAMWSPNIADFSKDYRVYAVDVMGQPSKSVPTEPVRNEADYAEWLTATLDGLHLRRISLVGMSYGGWLALNYAMAAPGRVERLVLLSPGGGFIPMARQFSLRGLLMVWFPTRFTVNTFMSWLGLKRRSRDQWTQPILELTYLGLKHFRVPLETLRVMPVMFPDDQLRAMRVPTLLLVGEHEVICNPVTALERARRLFPDIQAELVPRSSHEMCSSQHQVVDARVLEFLKSDRRTVPERVVA